MSNWWKEMERTEGEWDAYSGARQDYMRGEAYQEGYERATGARPPRVGDGSGEGSGPIVAVLLFGVFCALIGPAIEHVSDWAGARLGEAARSAPFWAALAMLGPPALGTLLLGPRRPLWPALKGFLRRFTNTVFAYALLIVALAAAFSTVFFVAHSVNAGHFAMADAAAAAWMTAVALGAFLTALAAFLAFRLWLRSRIGAALLGLGLAALACFLGDVAAPELNTQEMVDSLHAEGIHILP